MNGKESLPKKPKQKVITKFRTNADTAKKYLELGKEQEQERITKLLELAKLKTGWDLEAEIDQLIQELKGQTK
jgi:hypothetical protein